MATSGTCLVVTTELGARDTSKHPCEDRCFTTRNYLALNVSSAEVEEHWSRQLVLWKNL